MTKRTQKYRLTCEFLLKDKGDYARIREAIRKALHDIEHRASMQIDHMTIEKINERFVETGGIA